MGTMFDLKKIVRRTFMLTIDLAMIGTALSLAHLVRLWLDGFELFNVYDADMGRYAFSGLLFVFTTLLMYLFGLYTKRNDFWEETHQIFKTVFFVFVFALIFVFIIKATQEFSRVMVVLVFFNMLWLLPLGRVLGKGLLNKFHMWRKPVWIDGQKEQKDKLRHNLQINWYLGYLPVESFSEAEIVFIATKEMPVEKLERKIHHYKHSNKEVILIPYLHNISFANANIVNLIVGRMSLINIQNQLFVRKNLLMKQIAESVLVLLLLPLILLVLGIVSLLIAFDSKGPVFFKQRRFGKDSREFMCYKFRTMYVESEDRLQAYLQQNPDEVHYYEKYHKYQNDPRITRVGRILRKLSLDELPQMINVLKGEMNLIGPRPYMSSEKKKIGENVDTILHVAPGITGLWQVSGRNDLDFQERVELDTWYIQNWSLWLDFIIFVKTFEVLVTRRGAK